MLHAHVSTAVHKDARSSLVDSPLDGRQGKFTRRDVTGKSKQAKGYEGALALFGRCQEDEFRSLIKKGK